MKTSRLLSVRSATWGMSDDKLMTTMMMIDASASFGFGVSSFGLQKVQRSSARFGALRLERQGILMGQGVGVGIQKSCSL
jgi:hypothetical protein